MGFAKLPIGMLTTLLFSQLSYPHTGGPIKQLGLGAELHNHQSSSVAQNYHCDSLKACFSNCKAALASALQRPLSALALVLQQPPSLVLPCSYHTATLVTDSAITALATINPFRYATIPTTKALASYATTSVATILASYVTISITTIATDAQPRLLP